MDEKDRREVNRLWADIQVTQMLAAHLAAGVMTQDRIDQWHDARHENIDDREDWSEELRENMKRALDGLAAFMRISRGERDRRDPPPGK